MKVCKACGISFIGRVCPNCGAVNKSHLALALPLLFLAMLIMCGVGYAGDGAYNFWNNLTGGGTSVLNESFTFNVTSIFYVNTTSSLNPAIQIVANNVVLDCNGSTIKNGDKYSGWGFYSVQRTNITIKNCNFDGRGLIENSTNPSNWTENSANVWRFAVKVPTIRLFFDSVEYSMAQSNLTMNASHRWFYSSTYGLFVYSTSNPATAYSRIERPQWNTGLYLYLTKNSTVQNVNVSGAYGQAMYLLASSNNTIKDSTIGLYSFYGVLSLFAGANYADNNLYDNITFDSGHNFQNTWNTNGISDGLKFKDGATNNTVTNSRFYNWGHSAIYVSAELASGTSLTANNNRFYNLLIQDTGNSYNRGLNTDGDTNCASYNQFYNITINNTSAPNQLNGNDNLFTNITIMNTRNSPRDTTGDGIGIDVQDYSGYGKSYNNVFKNITIKNMGEYCIFIHENTTGHIFQDIVMENCNQNSISGKLVNVYITNLATPDNQIESLFYNNSDVSGRMRYNLFNGAINITVNETSTVSHTINFSNNGIVALNYNGLKNFNAVNFTFTLTSPSDSQNLSCNFGNGTVQNNFQVLTGATVSSNQKIYVETNCLYIDRSFNLSWYTPLCINQPSTINYTRVNYTFQSVKVSIGYNFTFKNLTSQSSYPCSSGFYSNQTNPLWDYCASTNVHSEENVTTAPSSNLCVYNWVSNTTQPRFSSMNASGGCISYSISTTSWTSGAIILTVPSGSSGTITNLAGHGLYDVTRDGAFVITTAANDITMTTAGTYRFYPHEGSGVVGSLSQGERYLFFLIPVLAAIGGMYMLMNGNLGFGAILIFIGMTIAVIMFRAVF